MPIKKFNKKDRHEKILEILAKNGEVEVNELTELFNMSDMSIRNDLNELDQQGKLMRRHGGAYVIESSKTEKPVTVKAKHNFYEKKIIGMEAAKLLHDGDSVMLDAGTTSEHIAPELSNYNYLTIITNGINIINKLLVYPNFNIYTVEGRIDSKSFSIIGEQAENTLKKYNAKIAFISADGLDVETGLTNNSHEATNIAKIILNNSQIKVLVADSSKFGKVGLFSLAIWEDIDILVTDYKIQTEIIESLEKRNIRVIIAKDKRNFLTDN